MCKNEYEVKMQAMELMSATVGDVVYDCAIVLIRHLNKKEGTKGLYRSLGSIDVVAAARSVMQVERDAEKSDIRIVNAIMVIKSTGDVITIAAGCKGILVAEIQENSNVTYRVYDYNRVDKNGKKRELHFDKAIQVMDMSVAPDVSQKPRMVKHYPGCSREILCRCKYFETEKIQVTKGFRMSEWSYFLGTYFTAPLFLEAVGS